ncbi:MAG: hypothetical protein PUC50_08590 [Bacteroidales bacterium]|nr:hypothetical protein [Bacteroidales bacterium]
MEKVNFNLSGMDILRHLLRIGLSVAAIIGVWQFYKPKDFVLSTALCMLIYVFVSMIVEMIFKSFTKKK